METRRDIVTYKEEAFDRGYPIIKAGADPRVVNIVN